MKRQWGHWRLNPKDPLCLEYLEHPGDDHWLYYVDLERCRTSAEVLDWLCQVSQKTWATSEDVGDLLRALDHLAGRLQSCMCGFGEEHGPVDWRDFVKQSTEHNRA
jgi:hypothetical protein